MNGEQPQITHIPPILEPLAHSQFAHNATAFTALALAVVAVVWTILVVFPRSRRYSVRQMLALMLLWCVALALFRFAFWLNQFAAW